MKKLTLFTLVLVSLALTSCTTSDEIYTNNDSHIIKQVFENDLSQLEVFNLIKPVIKIQVDSNIEYFACDSEDLIYFIGAMVLLESGNLKSQLTFHNNLLGIKKLKLRPSVLYGTNEYINKELKQVSGEFAVFYSFSDCFHNFFTIIKTTENKGKLRYKPLMEATTIAELCIEISACGYATDPKYTQKVYTIIKLLKTENKK